MKSQKLEYSKKLLDWYDTNARTLPWRENKNPYYIWVSEIMLQQTRVEAVKPYFKRFIETLPTLQDLAQIDDDSLKKLWEGLGYYRRVHNMKQCAKQCVLKYDGYLPDTYEALLDLPGIGNYTAGAIASIAFNEAVPAVDGNVMRVFARLLVIEDDISKEKTKRKFIEIVKAYIPNDRPGDFNQALMELGAMVCVPNAAPRCNICPLNEFCLAYKEGKANFLPNKAKQKARRIEKRAIVLLVYEDKVWITQRAENELLAKMYEFLNVEDKGVKTYLNENYKINEIKRLEKTKHIFSHVEWHMSGYLVELKEPCDGLFVGIKELEETYAMPTAYKMYREILYEYIKEKEHKL